MSQTPPPVLDTEAALLQGIYSEDEKKEILLEIEKAASSNHLSQGVDLNQFKPRKRGYLFPVVLNLLAIGFVVGAYFFLESFFQSKELAAKLKTDQLFSGANSVLSSVLEKSKQELAAKNQELNKIQSDLEKLSSEKNKLVQEFDSQLSVKEAELKDSLNKQLEEERKRLKSQGISEEEIAQKLRNFELAKNEEFNRNLERFRTQAQAAIEERTRELTALQSKLQSATSEQERLRAEIDKQSKDREKDLQNQISKQNVNLEKFVKEQEELNFFFKQADAEFEAVRGSLQTLDYPKALTEIGALKQLMTKAQDSKSEAVRQRAEANVAIAGALEKTVVALQASESKTAVDPKLETLRQQIRKAQAAVNPEDKRVLTQKAIEGFPEFEAAFQILKTYENQKELAAIDEHIQKAAKALEAGSNDEAFGALSDAVKSSALRENLAKVWGLRQANLYDNSEQLKLKQAELDALLNAQNVLLRKYLESPEDPTKTLTLAMLDEKIQEFKTSIDALMPYKLQVQSLTAAFEKNRDLAIKTIASNKSADFETAKRSFLQTFDSVEGSQLFPDFANAFQAFLDTQSIIASGGATDPKPIRNQAFEDVLSFTTYLKGTSADAKAAQDRSERLSRSDEKYKQVVDTIQALLKTGPKETLIKTNKYQLLGAMLSLSGLKGIVEPLTKAQPSVGQGVEIRRATAKGDLVIAQGKVAAIASGKIEIELSPILNAPSSPSTGDAVYLVLP